MIQQIFVFRKIPKSLLSLSSFFSSILHSAETLSFFFINLHTNSSNPLKLDSGLQIIGFYGKLVLELENDRT